MSAEWYYTAKGQQQGPVGEEQLRQLYGTGQLEPGALVWKEGLANWMPASAALAEGTPTLAPLGTPQTDLAPAFLTPAGTLDLGKCMTDGWEVFKRHWALGLAAFVIYFFLSIILQIPIQVVSVFLPWLVPHDLAHYVPFLALGLALVYTLLILPITFPLIAGFMYFFLGAARNQPNLSDLFLGFRKRLLSLMALSYVMCLIVWTGLLLLILPGIYLGVCYFYAIVLVLDRNLGFWEAMELSRKTIHAQWWVVFALFLITGVIASLGILLCGFGILATIPLAYFILIEGYRQLFPDTGHVKI